MKAEYEKFKAQSGGKEYHARHILVEKEEDAKAIISKLKSGSKFEELTKGSKDPVSGQNGGDLGWAPANAFVKPFSDAMVALKVGEFTQAPVQTEFGFHVIRLDEVRDAQIPKFEEVKAQIAESLQQKKLQNFQQDLKKKAKIQ
jgi:peptidyl-prolyl cis-trans isomerase C